PRKPLSVSLSPFFAQGPMKGSEYACARQYCWSAIWLTQGYPATQKAGQIRPLAVALQMRLRAQNLPRYWTLAGRAYQVLRLPERPRGPCLPFHEERGRQGSQGQRESRCGWEAMVRSSKGGWLRQ